MHVGPNVCMHQNQTTASHSHRHAELEKKLREQLCPTTNKAVMARVAQELRSRGGFQPLMLLFPLPGNPPGSSGSSAASTSAASASSPKARGRLQQQQQQQQQQEEAQNGGAADGAVRIPWDRRDFELRDQMKKGGWDAALKSPVKPSPTKA